MISSYQCEAGQRYVQWILVSWNERLQHTTADMDPVHYYQFQHMRVSPNLPLPFLSLQASSCLCKLTQKIQMRRHEPFRDYLTNTHRCLRSISRLIPLFYFCTCIFPNGFFQRRLNSDSCLICEACDYICETPRSIWHTLDTKKC